MKGGESHHLKSLRHSPKLQPELIPETSGLHMIEVLDELIAESEQLDQRWAALLERQRAVMETGVSIRKEDATPAPQSMGRVRIQPAQFCSASGKRGFSEDEANKVARLAQRRDTKKRPRHVYQCDDCGLWHVSSARKYVEKPTDSANLPPLERRTYRPRGDGTLEPIDPDT